MLESLFSKLSKRDSNTGVFPRILGHSFEYTIFFNKQHFYKQCHAEIGKKFKRHFETKL